MKHDEFDDWPEVVRWEPDRIEYTRSPTPSRCPDLGWCVVLCGYDETDKLRVSRHQSIDIIGYTQLMKAWCKEHIKEFGY